MGWSIGYDDRFDRFIGYGVPTICDHPGCNKEIDRGLSYVCGGEPYGGEHGCGLYFCPEHRDLNVKPVNRVVDLCERCSKNKEPFEPKPEHKKWVKHLLKHKSWEEWRKDNPDKVKALRGE